MKNQLTIVLCMVLCGICYVTYTSQHQASASAAHAPIPAVSSHQIDQYSDDLQHIMNPDYKLIKELRVLTELSTIALSEDKTLIVVGFENGRIKNWKINENNEMHKIAILGGHEDWVASIALSLDAKMIVSASWDQTVSVWTTNDAWTNQNQPTAILSNHGDGVSSVALSSDTKTIVSGVGSGNPIIKVWTTNNAWTNQNQATATLTGHQGEVLSVALSPDAKMIVSGSKDNTIKIWTTNNLWTNQNQATATLSGHAAPVTSVALSADAKTIISGSQDKTLKVWKRLPRGVWQLVATTPTHGEIRSVALSPDKKTIVAGMNNKSVMIWQLQKVDMQPTLAQTALLALLAQYKNKNPNDPLSLWGIAQAEDNTTLTEIMRQTIRNFPENIKHAIIAYFDIDDMQPSQQEQAYFSIVIKNLTEDMV